MIACGSLSCASQCVSNTMLGPGRDLARFAGDLLWDSMQTEAIVEANQEPLLRPLIEQAVLHRSSFGDGVAMMLSRKLCDQVSDLSTWHALFRDVIAENPAITESAAKDLRAIRANDPAATSLLHPFLNFKGFHAVQAYRVSHALWSSDRRGLAYYLQNRISEVLSVDIHPAAIIGSGIFIDHATGVVVGETAIIGDDVTILHGVTLGGTGKASGDRHPKVGRGVFIGANAQLLGNVVVGDGSRIGASSVVLRNVEADSTVAGIPARVVRREHRPTLPLSTLEAARA